jgi:hypothetical protein
MTDGIPGVCAGSCGPARGHRLGLRGSLDVLAGDLVAAGNAVGVDGEQDTHAVPGAGGDFGGRGAGGQPQRQRGMTQVVGARRGGQELAAQLTILALLSKEGVIDTH